MAHPSPSSTVRRIAALHNVAFLASLLWGGPNICHAQTTDEVRVGGSGAGSVVLQHMVEHYSKLLPTPSARVVMPPLGTTGGLAALGAGVIQIAVLGRRPLPDEAISSTKVAWARTPFVLVARDAPANTNLSSSEVGAILSGKTTHWPDGQLIRLVLRPPQNPDTPLLRAMGPDIDASLTLAHQRVGIPFSTNDLDNQQLLERTTGAFGTMALGHVRLTSQKLKPLNLNGVEPSVDNLLKGRYGHQKVFYLATGPNPSAATQRFMAYLRSPQAWATLAPLGFVPLER
jgi:phosphate transport system substrate-binding protein